MSAVGGWLVTVAAWLSAFLADGSLALVVVVVQGSPGPTTVAASAGRYFAVAGLRRFVGGMTFFFFYRLYSPLTGESGLHPEPDGPLLCCAGPAWSSPEIDTDPPIFF